MQIARISGFAVHPLSLERFFRGKNWKKSPLTNNEGVQEYRHALKCEPSETIETAEPRDARIVKLVDSTRFNRFRRTREPDETL